jgi:rhamnulokinase
MSKHLAFDLGAESGRAVIINLDEQKVTMKQIHRFPNRPTPLAGTLYWDFHFLFAEILHALRICAEKNIKIDSIGVDTWGVDFGLLGHDGHLLASPVHYRDKRTDNIHQYSNQTLSTMDIFIETGCEPWQISSLFQLLAMKKNNSPLLQLAQTFLNMPDLVNYFLTGIKASEKSIVSTANLMATDGNWSRRIIDAFDLPDIFHNLVEPATVLGPLSEQITAKADLKPVPVVATCGHDTSAVVAAVPATGKNWAFLSCGTWSILGKLCQKPVTPPEALKNGFTNEYTIGSWFIGRNILGLWLIQELRRKWNNSADPWDYDRMTKEAANAHTDALVDVNDNSLMAPPDMEKALLELLKKLKQPKPDSRGGLIHTVLQSLALDYACRLEMVNNLTKQPTDALYMVGGGVANKLLCQFTANACRIPVHAGVEQCTSLGNALTQAVALGQLTGPEQIRQIMRKSFNLTTYQPKNDAVWTEKLQKYKQLKDVL